MKSIICAAAALALAGTASAGTFSIGAVDASNGDVSGGVVGTGIDIIGGEFYHDANEGLGATAEPNSNFFGFVPALEFDTYLTIDSGPITTTYKGTDVGAASELLTGNVGDPDAVGFTPNSYRGSWFIAGPPVGSFPTSGKPADANNEIFVGRLTYTGTLSGSIAVTIAEQDTFGTSQIVGNIVSETDVANGIGIITTDINGVSLTKSFTSRGYAWVAKEFTTVIDSVTYTVSDIYLQNVLDVPTPGALGLLSVAGVAATRRRRK